MPECTSVHLKPPKIYWGSKLPDLPTVKGCKTLKKGKRTKNDTHAAFHDLS